MQGHVIPIAYQPMIPTHSGMAAAGAGNVQTSPAHQASSTLTELLAPGSAVTSSSVREGGGKQGKMIDVGMQPYSPGQQQHHSTTIRYGPTGKADYTLWYQKVSVYGYDIDGRIV